MKKLISINFIKTNNKNNSICLNPDNYPIIFYWDGTMTIFDALVEDLGFINLLKSQYCTVDNYSNINLYMNEFDIEEESYSQEILELQSKLPLSLDILQYLAYKYIETILLDLYKISIKEEYKLLVESDIDNIVNIYTILKDRYKERINPETLKNYILSQLQQKYQLNQTNCDYVIKIYSDIIS